MNDKYEKPFKLDMNFDEALRRAAQTDKSEVDVSMAQGEHEPVQLVEDGDTGDKLLIYATDDNVEVEFHYKNDTLWMTQSQMAELFGRDVASISRHIRNIFDDNELTESTSLQKVQRSMGRPLTIYNLDMVISVGYRVSSRQATMFRRWATDKLVQFATKGFVVDTEKLKDPDNYDRVKELREIIRDIRASEANVYKEIRSICAMCQDYEGGSKQAQTFYATMQNKLLWAISSHTAAELIIERSDAEKPNMGLETWPNENIRKADVIVAHNYLAEPEIKEKNRFTVMLLDFFEDRLELGKLTTMAQAEFELDKFIKFNDRALLSWHIAHIDLISL